MKTTKNFGLNETQIEALRNYVKDTQPIALDVLLAVLGAMDTCESIYRRYRSVLRDADKVIYGDRGWLRRKLVDCQCYMWMAKHPRVFVQF